MSDKDVNKVHQEAAEHTQKMHNYAVAGKGAEVGGMALAHDQAQVNGITLSEKKKKEAADLKALLDLQTELDNLFDGMSGKLDDYKKSLNISKRIKEAMDSGDTATLTLILQEQGRDTDGKTTDEIFEMGSDELKVQELTRETLAQEIKDMAEDYKSKPNLTEAQMDRLEELREQAQNIEGLDFYKVFGDCFEKKNGFQNEVENFLANVDTPETFLSEDPFSKNNEITDAFNIAATNEQTGSPFALENDSAENSPSLSNNDVSNSPNPFG